MNQTMQKMPAAPYWSLPHEELLRQLRTSPDGLKAEEAEQRLKMLGPNLLRPKKRTDTLTLFASQFKSPIILILLFAAGSGDIIPGDSRLLDAKDCFVDEAALTGETLPVEKTVGTVPPETAIAQRENTLFMSTYVVSGTAKVVVATTGTDTEFGKVSERLKLRRPETEFEHGVRRFGYFLMELTLLLVIAIFAVNVYLKRPVLDSFLFALALAVGLTPQLLPAIVSINLAHGAKRMARGKTIVKRLASIENFGSMNVLCSDKTGTITEGNGLSSGSRN